MLQLCAGGDWEKCEPDTMFTNYPGKLEKIYNKHTSINVRIV